MFNPLEHPIVFTPPLRLARSTWLSHVPFGMLLVHLLKPNLIVELGTYTGVSYCSFCQIVDQAGSNTRCIAIDTWQGDPQQGYYEDGIFEELKQYHDPLYGNFSHLLRCTFDMAIDRIEDQSIDLLHIDGCHTYEAVQHDFMHWLPKMSDHGVILFHDTQEKSDDFGVWKLWQEIKSTYLSFEFTHGHGLGVIIVGEDPPRGVIKFMSEAIANPDTVRLFFSTLGEKVQLSYLSRIQKQQIDDQTRAIDWLYGQVSEYKDISHKWYMRGIRAMNQYGIAGFIVHIGRKISKKS